MKEQIFAWPLLKYFAFHFHDPLTAATGFYINTSTTILPRKYSTISLASSKTQPLIQFKIVLQSAKTLHSKIGKIFHFVACRKNQRVDGPFREMNEAKFLCFKLFQITWKF